MVRQVAYAVLSALRDLVWPQRGVGDEQVVDLAAEAIDADALGAESATKPIILLAANASPDFMKMSLPGGDGVPSPSQRPRALARAREPTPLRARAVGGSGLVWA
jgi:hypothetical protein